MLSKITRKPVLEEKIPEVITIVNQTKESDTVDLIKETFPLEDLINEISIEIFDYDKLISEILPEVSLYRIDLNEEQKESLGISELTVNHLDQNFNNQLDLIKIWEENSYKDLNSGYSIFYPILKEINSELKQSLNYLSNLILDPNNLFNIINAEKERLKLSKDIKNNIIGIKERTKKEIEECLVKNIITTILYEKSSLLSKSSLNSTSNSINKLQSIGESIRKIRKVLRSALVVYSLDIKNTRENINKLIYGQVYEAAFKEALLIFNEVENIITNPIINFIQDSYDISQQLCHSFDELLELSVYELEKLREKYILHIYNYYWIISNKFSLRTEILTLVNKKFQYQKQIEVLDAILEVLEQFSISGDINSEVQDLVRQVLKKKKPNISLK